MDVSSEVSQITVGVYLVLVKPQNNGANEQCNHMQPAL